jgi:predicted regulator of Ras-like GTPase activity (Roadblock/LC7/MglB family)
MSRTEELSRILRQLQAGTPEIEASALISDDGLMIASALPPHIDEARVAAISSTLISLGTRAAAELQRGAFDQVLVRGAQGYVVLMVATQGTMLLTLANREAKLGLVFLDMSKSVEQIQKIL